MNPEIVQTGNLPGSNQILENEATLIESKKDKCLELFRQNTEVHDILESAKQDRCLMAAVGAIDLNSMMVLLFDDRHFLNCKS